MTRRIRIPGVVDLLRIDEPEVITQVSREQRLDRDFVEAGPFLNRYIARRVRQILQVDGTPLPSVAPRDYVHRAEKQAALEESLKQLLANGEPAPDHLDALAAYVQGVGGDATVGMAAQEAIGRLFVPDYRASGKTWRAACVFDAAPRNFNPIRGIVWALTAAVWRARRTLARAVKDNPAGMHATGIAVHSLVRSLKAMRELWHEAGARDRLSADAAVVRSLRAPEQVLRQWAAPAVTGLGEMRPGALTMFQLDAARTRAPGPDIVFMSESWSRCPATLWVAALLRAVWTRATAAPGAGAVSAAGAAPAAGVPS
jgi:hypothetical protein